MEVISLSCPSCGSNLEVTKDLDRFACGYCGKQLLVNRSGGIVSIKPLVEKLDHISVSVDRTASELAIKRLKEEINEIEDEIDVAYSKKVSVKKISFLCVVGLVLGFLVILMSFNNQGTINIFCGLVPTILAGALLYFTYWAAKGWDKKIAGIVSELNVKNTQLKKHLNIVNG